MIIRCNSLTTDKNRIEFIGLEVEQFKREFYNFS